MPAARTKTERQRLGAALKAMREEAQVSQDAVAGALGLAGNDGVSRIESGQVRPYFDQVVSFERACGQPIGAASRLAGLATIPTTVTELLDQDVDLTPRWRTMILAAYESALVQSADERSAAASRSAKKARKRRS